jgi:hypothetical protein
MKKEGKSYPKTVCVGIVLVWVAVAIWPEVIGIVVILISGVGLLISGVVLGMKTKTTIFGDAIPGCGIFDFEWLSAAPSSLVRSFLESYSRAIPFTCFRRV